MLVICDSLCSLIVPLVVALVVPLVSMSKKTLVRGESSCKVKPDTLPFRAEDRKTLYVIMQVAYHDCSFLYVTAAAQYRAPVGCIGNFNAFTANGLPTSAESHHQTCICT